LLPADYFFAADADAMYFVLIRRLVYVTLVGLRHIICYGRSLTREMWREEEDIDNVRLLASIMEPDVAHPAPNAVEEEDTVLLSWRQTLGLLTGWDFSIQYTAWLHELEAAMNDRLTAHKMLAMDQPEREVLKDLRQILLAADTTIPSTRVESSKQSFLSRCNTIGSVPLIGMSYPLLDMLNVVDLLRSWHGAD